MESSDSRLKGNQDNLLKDRTKTELLYNRSAGQSSPPSLPVLPSSSLMISSSSSSASIIDGSNPVNFFNLLLFFLDSLDLILLFVVGLVVKRRRVSDELGQVGGLLLPVLPHEKEDANDEDVVGLTSSSDGDSIIGPYWSVGIGLSSELCAFECI